MKLPFAYPRPFDPTEALAPGLADPGAGLQEEWKPPGRLSPDAIASGMCSETIWRLNPEIANELHDAITRELFETAERMERESAESTPPDGPADRPVDG